MKPAARTTRHPATKKNNRRAAPRIKCELGSAAVQSYGRAA